MCVCHFNGEWPFINQFVIGKKGGKLLSHKQTENVKINVVKFSAKQTKFFILNFFMLTH